MISRGHVAVDERQQQRGDVMTVRVRVRQDDDRGRNGACARSKFLPSPQPSAVDEIGQLLVLEHLRERRALGVQDLAAQRQDRLARAIASLLRRSAGRVSLDDEDLAVVAAW